MVREKKVSLYDFLRSFQTRYQQESGLKGHYGEKEERTDTVPVVEA